jgi:tRNA (guanine37-N1)-methyltransferase
MDIEVLSLFPRYIEGPLQESILGRAIRAGLCTVRSVDIRDFATRADRRVDDRPFGGGPGMVMMAGPVVSAIRSCRRNNSHVIYLNPQGKKLTSKTAQRLAQLPHLILLSGHYEGIDQRALDEVDEHISIGDYVLTNGCLAALVLIDAVARFIPGVLGHEDAAACDSFATGLFDHPQFTQPRVFEGKEVPEILFSGDHAKISLWRAEQARDQTQHTRPDVLGSYFHDQINTYSEEKGTVQQVILPSFHFAECCRFYEKILGSPQLDKQQGVATFSQKSISLTLVFSSTTVDSHTSLSIAIPEAIFSSILRKLQRFREEPENSASFRDPDGRSILLSRV